MLDREVELEKMESQDYQDLLDQQVLQVIWDLEEVKDYVENLDLLEPQVP